MPQNLNCIAVEDELIFRKAICSLIQEHNQLNLLGVFESSEDAKNQTDFEQVDIAFLDILTPGKNGLQFAKELREFDVEVIFTTAMINMAVQAFDIDACDYLVKPIEKDRFNKAINKAMAIFHANNRSANNSVIHNITSDDILYIKKDGDYIRIVHKDGYKRLKYSLRKAMDLMESSSLIRIHKSYLVNVDKIEKVKKDLAYLGGETIPISRQGRSVLVKKMKIW